MLSQLAKLQVLVLPCTRARVNLKTWDGAAKMRMHSSIHNVLWNKWSSCCVSEPVRLKYLGKSCVLIGQLSCLLFQCSLANLQGVSVVGGSRWGFSLSVLN